MALKPPVPRPSEPPTDKPPGSTTTTGDGTVTPPVKQLPTWLRWETYGSCSHDEQCRPKMLAAIGVAAVAFIALGMWLHKPSKEPT